MSIMIQPFVLWVALWVAKELNFAQNVVFKTPGDSLTKAPLVMLLRNKRGMSAFPESGRSITPENVEIKVR